jgi:hypothetical protein
MTLLTRFEKKFVKTSGCWLWQGDKWARPEHGYGRIWLNGRRVKAHRVAWELYVGPIPPGQHVLHKCDVRLCVNPEHLFLGTKIDNNTDRDQKGRTAIEFQRKLTDAQVFTIRNDPRFCRVIAVEYGVSLALVAAIKTGQRRATACPPR